MSAHALLSGFKKREFVPLTCGYLFIECGEGLAQHAQFLSNVTFARVASHHYQPRIANSYLPHRPVDIAMVKSESQFMMD